MLLIHSSGSVGELERKMPFDISQICAFYLLLGLFHNNVLMNLQTRKNRDPSQIFQLVYDLQKIVVDKRFIH